MKIQEEPKRAEAFLSIRMYDEDKALIVQAAEREGLQLSSFFIMVLVRLKILPESRMAKIKRRPVEGYNVLHGLLGVVNKIGGNRKQLAALPDANGLGEAHASLIRAAAAITDCLKGKPIPASVNIYRLQEKLTNSGYALNQIVKSINIGRPDFNSLPETLAAVRDSADSITAALTGEPIEDSATIRQKAQADIRISMKMAAQEITKRQQD